MPVPVWVFLRDKGPRSAERWSEARGRLTPRALSRRQTRGTNVALVTFEDLPLERDHVDAVLRVGVRLRHRSRWFNALSVEADATQIRSLALLPGVARLDLVRRRVRSPEPTPAPLDEDLPPIELAPHVLDYGDSYGQLAQINVPAVHDRGLHGEGVVVALLDSGFDNLGHEALATTDILATRDFVNGDDDVGDGTDLGEGSHGTATLSTLGGFKQGQLVGPAYAASFILAKTENSENETIVEEDNWAAAAEWAEEMGADVISSSLSYFAFDDPTTSYSYEDMNGETAISTRAAELAAARGVVVVNSAGNGGFSERGNIGAPADGKRVLSAGAVDPDSRRTSFSSVGPTADGRIKPDLAAQGRAVKIAASEATDLYRRANGTSFSCPLIAGVAALVLQAHPGYSVEQVSFALRSTASQASAPDNLLGWGIVDALAAILAPPGP